MTFCVTALGKIRLFHLRHVYVQFQIGHITSRSFLFSVSGCFSFYQIDQPDQLLWNGTTFLDHTGPTDKNGFYYFPFLSLISYRSENLMKRSRATNQFLKMERQISDWLARPIKLDLLKRCSLFSGNFLVGPNRFIWFLIIKCFPRMRILLCLCTSENMPQLNAWNMLLFM